MKKITATLEWTKDGYSVWFDELPSVFSYGATVEQAKAEARKAIDLYFEDERQPAWYKNGFEIDVKFDVAALINCYQHIFTKRALSKITGINESLLSQYATGLKKPRKQQVERIEKGLHTLSQELSVISLR
ncbi:MAG: type II toxin-antitoxin system HicB family antitoxin [Rikenellaceae bacterium]